MLSLPSAKLDVELGCINILSLLSHDGVANHDFSTDCQKHQVALRGFNKRCAQNDMTTPFFIPDKFDEHDPASAQNGPFVNLLKDFSQISDEKAQAWQRFFNKFAAPVEIESSSWANDIMENSMTPRLKALVNDDLKLIDEIARGAITTFKIMSNHMVLKNQETIDAMHEWLHTFDTCNINGQNVAVAAGKCCAIIRALDNFGLITCSTTIVVTMIVVATIVADSKMSDATRKLTRLLLRNLQLTIAPVTMRLRMPML